MFTRKLTSQQKWMMLLVFVPLYFFCSSIIVSALIYFVCRQFSLTFLETTLNAYLNLLNDLLLVCVVVAVFKESLVVQAKDFLKDWKKNALYGFVIGTLLMYFFNIVGGVLTIILGGTSSSENQTAISSIMQNHALLIAFVSVVLAPIVEELFFRGTIFAWLYELSPILAHLLSGFLFGFVHIMDAVISGQSSEWVYIFSYFFMGCVLSYLYEKRNNIYVPMIAHGMNNLIAILMMFIAS